MVMVTGKNGGGQQGGRSTVSVETGRGAEADVPWGAALAGSRSFRLDAGRRRPSALRITEARGPAACLRRDALFRRSLLAADILAIVTAFILTVGLSSRSLQLTWISMACLPALLFWAKLNGLYDRDESLIRKTTLDEAPKLFQLATLCALFTWLWSGLFVSGGRLDRHQALFLWLGLAGLPIPPPPPGPLLAPLAPPPPRPRVFR